MKKALLLAAMAAALPGAVPAQEEKAPPFGRDCPESARADSALPARASIGPAPQLGTVAPNTRVPSDTLTPSRRAMAAARARDEKTTHAQKNVDQPCGENRAPDAPQNGRMTPASD